MAFSYLKEVEPLCLIFKLHGRFLEQESDNSIMEEIALELNSSERHFILDMKEMEYINSLGINALVRIVNQANLQERKIVFVSVPERIMELLNIIKLNAVFTIKNSRDEGINYLNN